MRNAKLPATLWEAEQQIAELRDALQPFANLSRWIAENRAEYDSDGHEVQIEGWPYTLSVGWLRKAAMLTASVDTHRMAETGNTDSVRSKPERREAQRPNSVRASLDRQGK